jgi:serine/threonine protein kinase
MSSGSKFFVPSADRKLGDRYELLECLGDGSYGWVWRAARLQDGAIVALKIPKAQGKKNEELAEGSQLIGQPPHPNVVAVNWMGRVPPEREWYVIEMEYFPSLTLAQHLDRSEEGFVASYDRLLRVYEQVLHGIAHLHHLGMTHGDIKPQNILVSAELVKLTDFGASVLPEEMYTRTRENGGTILYSAPEVVGATIRRSEANTYFLADVYSLGVLLYHLVTSRLPHDTLSQVARHAPFPRAREINPSVSPALDEFIEKSLKLDPKERWSSVNEMLERLRRIRRAQLEFTPTRVLPPKYETQKDWSSQALDYLEKGEYHQAENVARAAFDSSKDHQAFSLMVTAAFRDGRHFDCIKELEANATIVNLPNALGIQLRRLALSAYLETRQIEKAQTALQLCLRDTPDEPSLLLKKASLLAIDARYEEAIKVLLDLNRRFPGRSVILKRLVAAYEQLRDIGKASAFLKTYLRLIPNDPWGIGKMENYNTLGIG